MFEPQCYIVSGTYYYCSFILYSLKIYIIVTEFITIIPNTVYTRTFDYTIYCVQTFYFSAPRTRCISEFSSFRVRFFDWSTLNGLHFVGRYHVHRLRVHHIIRISMQLRWIGPLVDDSHDPLTFYEIISSKFHTHTHT